MPLNDASKAGRVENGFRFHFVVCRSSEEPPRACGHYGYGLRMYALLDLTR